MKMIQRSLNKEQGASEERSVNEVKLTYSDQMKEQDTLWDTAIEDLKSMIKLHESILNEARSMGWNGYAVTYTIDDPETVTELYKNERDWKDGKAPLEISAPCKRLIEELENLLKEQREIEADSMLIAECLQNHRKITVTKDGRKTQLQCDLYADGTFYSIKNRIPDFSFGVTLEEVRSSQ